VRLSDLLSPRRVVVPLPAATLEEGMRILVDACVADRRVGDPVRLDAAIRESWPEDTMSLGPHAWLPHFRTDAVPALVVALGIAPAPIAGARDGGRDATREAADPRMILLVVAPPREHAAYLQTVGAFARALSRPELAAALVAARSADEVLALPGLREVELEGQLLVRDLMRAIVTTLRPDDTLDEAARRLEAHGLTAIPVVGDAGQVVGLLSHRELLKALAPGFVQRVTAGAAPPGSQGTRVRDAMARSVLCISEDQTLADAAHLLAKKDVDWVPVVKDGVLRGAVTRADLVQRLLVSR
jgi:CBS domain-containing protein/mannitol/fructose-specific phosphotransferase system IIA component (Ntr-type)